MHARQLYPFESFAQSQLRSRLEYSLDQKELFAALDADPDLIGAGVVYVDSKHTVVELRSFEPLCRVKPIKIILREPPRTTSSLEFAADLASEPRESRMVMEAMSTALAL